MRGLVFITLLHMCASKTSLPAKPRSVNLALETVVEFDNKENSANVQIIDKVQSFLDRVRGVIENKVSRRNSANGKIQFTDFIKQALDILRDYNDSDLEDVVSVAADEIRKYHYKGCKFYELFENSSMRRVMADNLDKIKNAPVKAVKENLKTILRTFEKNNFDSVQETVVNYVNSIYGAKSEGMFKHVLDNLATYKSRSKRTNMNLVQMVRDGIRSVVFDTYSRLDGKTRRDLKLKLETFWNYLNHPEKSQRQVWKFKPSNTTDADKKGDVRGQISGSVEIQRPLRNRKPASKSKSEKSRHKKSKRHRDDSSTDRAHVTLYQDAIVRVKARSDKKHKRKSTKTSKHATRFRGHGHERILRSKIKHNKAREIITEHAAVINVKKDTMSKFLDQLLGHRGRKTPKTAMEERKTHKRHRTTDVGYWNPEYQPDLISHQKTRRPKHENLKRKPFKKSKYKKSNIDIEEESSEGLSIMSFEHSTEHNLAIHSFRKSNDNDSSLNNVTTIALTHKTTSPEPDTNVLNRINELEKELKVVKEQMKTTDRNMHEDPQYEPLDFWEGTTTEKAHTTTVETTTKSTSATKTTTTTPQPSITTNATQKLTTKLDNNTFAGIFRTNNDSNERKMLGMQEKKFKFKAAEEESSKAPHKNKSLSDKNSTKTSQKNKHANEHKETTQLAQTKKLETHTTHANVSNIVHLSRDSENALNFNNSAEEDYINDFKEPGLNMTGIADLERYLNNTHPTGRDEKTREVRKEMLQRLESIFPKTPQEVLNSTVSQGTKLSDVTSDPMDFLDDNGDMD